MSAEERSAADQNGASLAPAPEEVHALAPGTRFGDLEITRTLGVGGFGIVYLAQDHALERQVAIKEYMPGQLALRGDGSQVSVRAGSLQETFELGRRSFVNEARLLARFDHRSLLKVYQFWESNGTAYMVMPYLQGKNLRQACKEMADRPSEAWLMRLVLPLLEGLAQLHAAGVVHRDVAPDNILLPDDGADPILLDFGAARRAISDRTQSFTAILKPNYAPIEQYAEATNLRQGPWTDLYALGAVLHYLVLGRTPPPATTRTLADEYEPLINMDLPGLSPQFRASIDWALAVRPQDRPQSAAELRAALLGERPPMTVAPPPPLPLDEDLDDHAETEVLDFDSTVFLERFDDVAPGNHPPPAPEPGLLATLATRHWRAGATVVLLGVAGLIWALRLGPPTAAPELTAGGPAASDAVVEVIEPSASQVAAAAAAASMVAAIDAAASAPGAMLTQAAAADAARAASAAALAPAARIPDRRVDPRLAQPSAPIVDARLARQQAPAPAPVRQTEPAPAAPAPAPAPAAPADPLEACQSLGFFARGMCIARECEKPALANHAECARMNEIREERRRGSGR